MCAYQVDEIGLPVDPELRKLELSLSTLAANWRGNWGNPQRQEEIVREYRAVIARLYSLGWNGILDADSELPDELLPEEYVRRNQVSPESKKWKA